MFYDLNYVYELIFMKKYFLLISISFNFSKKWYFCLKSFSTRKIGPNRPIFQLNSPNTVCNKVKSYYSESFVLGAWSWAYRTVPMYIPGICQNDRDEKLNQQKFTLTITLTVTRQERNFHCMPSDFYFKRYWIFSFLRQILFSYLVLH